MSSGRYIYGWPEKFDQMFWPFADPHAISHGPASGFLAMVRDMDSISEAERQHLASWLPAQDLRHERMGLAAMLDALEATYSQHEIAVTARIAFTRAWADMAESALADHERAGRLRRSVQPLMREMLAGEQDIGQRLTHLFVLANDERKYGGIGQADTDLADVGTVLDPVDDDELKGLVDDLRAMIPGSRRIGWHGALALAPVPGTAHPDHP